MALIEIKEDLFFISKRIKEIDRGYFIVFNTKRDRFEVHHKNQPINTFCLIVPDRRLDASLLEYVRKTKSENQKRLLLEIERQNKQREKANKEKIIEEGFEKVKELGKRS